MSNTNIAILSNLGAGFITRATASPYAICLGTGLVGASYVAWGAGGAGAARLLSDKERSRAGVGREEALKVWAWAFQRGAVGHPGCYECGLVAHQARTTAQTYGLPATIITALSFIGAAFQIPPSSFTQTPRQVRNFIFGIAGVWLLHGAYGMAIRECDLIRPRYRADFIDSPLTSLCCSPCHAINPCYPSSRLVPPTVLPTSSRLLTLRKQLDARDTSLSPVQASEADALMQRWAAWQWGRVVLGGVGWVGAVAAYLSI